MIYNEPEASKDEIDDLQDKDRIAVTVDMQGPCGAHGAGKERTEAVGCIDKKKQGDELKCKNIREDRRYEIGPPFEIKLQAAAALKVPSSDYPYSIVCGVECKKTDEDG
jgi:hypothetical protein